MDHKFEHGHHPEVAQGGKAIRRLEKLNIKKKLENSSARRNFFSELSDEQFKKMLGYINSLTQRKKTSYEYEDGQMPMGDTPPLEDKEGLMNEAFSTVGAILAGEGKSPEESLRLAALTIAGAINYIHPYGDGNGRTGRIIHYLMEYGSERSKIFEQELYALIAKIPLLENDEAQVIYDTPPPELELAIGKYAEKNTRGYQDLDARAKASARARIFLQMMKGSISIQISENVNIWSRFSTQDKKKRVHFGPDEIGGTELYLQSYILQSTAPNRTGVIPPGSVLNTGIREVVSTTGNVFKLDIDFV